jgi:hypothetical protein
MGKFGVKRILFVFSIALAATPSARAQASGGTSISSIEPRNAVSVILMSGLVGGILGLSTLSFYDRPQENIRNITIGAGVGMIAAALYMTYSVSQSPSPSAFHWAPSVGDGQAGVLASLHF